MLRSRLIPTEDFEADIIDDEDDVEEEEENSFEMVDLRQRATRAGGYARLTTEDLDNDIPMIRINHLRTNIPIRKSNFCVQFCMIFSISGIIFLSTIGIMLYFESPNIRLEGSSNDQKKSVFLQGVIGAIIMYVVCLLVCFYLWCSNHYRAPRLDHNSSLLD